MEGVHEVGDFKAFYYLCLVAGVNKTLG